MRRCYPEKSSCRTSATNRSKASPQRYPRRNLAQKKQGFAVADQMRGLLKRMFDQALTCGLVQASPVMTLPIRHNYRGIAHYWALKPDEVRQFLCTLLVANICRLPEIVFHQI